MARRSRSRPAAKAVPPARPRRRRMGWRRLLFLVVLFGVVAVGAAVRLLAELSIPEPAGADETSIVYDRHGTVIAYLHAEQNRIPVSLEEVAPVLIDAVVASEDRDFFRHPGVDPVAIGRAAWADIRQEGELQGGSTITQQYVKNAFLNADRTLVRKLREAVLAIKIERELSKQEILERYLNVIYFGRGAYGIEAASRVWFGRSAAELDVARAAYLASLIRAPELADVSRPEQVPLAEERYASVLAAMFEEGYITAAERDRAAATLLTGLALPRAQNSSVQVSVEGIGLEHPVEVVRRELIERYGAARVFAGGLRVTTSLDLAAQGHAMEAATTITEQSDAPEVALVVLDDQGHVRAMVGGSDFAVSQVNLATGVDGGGGGRQPGSAAKTLALVSALEQGYALSTLLPAPAQLTVPNADGGEDWVVANADGVDRGSLSLVDALKVSSNTAFASLAVAIDLDELVELGSRLGVTAELRPFPSLALGAQEVSVLDMATAYSVIAAGGVLFEPITVLSVSDSEGELDERFTAARSVPLSTEVASAASEALRLVVSEGTGHGAAVAGLEVGGKTGTSQDNRDAWFVGFTDRFTAAVWMGYPDDGRPMLDVLGVGAVTGGGHPAQLFAEVMHGLHSVGDAGGALTPAS